MTNEEQKIYDPVEVDTDFFAQNEQEQELFYSKVKTLPGPIIDILFGLDTASLIEGICMDERLNQKQSAELARLIRKTVIADVYIGDMPAQISSKLGVDQNVALEIARNIVSQLFAPAIEDIKKLQLQKFGKLPGSSAQPSLQARPSTTYTWRGIAGNRRQHH